MSFRRSGAIALLIGLFASTALAADARPARKASTRPAASRPAQVVDDPNLPRVLIIGDSISIGYTEPVRKLLAGKANVHRIPVNGGPTTRGIENIDSWLKPGNWDVIHFNWGLHDLKYMPDGKHQVSIEDYAKNLRELVGKLEQTKAKLIWATTTPVPEAKTEPLRKNSDVIAYNAVARKIMDENELAIDDLYIFAMPKLSEIQLPANVHYTPAGYKDLAEHVAASIKKSLPKKPGHASTQPSKSVSKPKPAKASH